MPRSRLDTRLALVVLLAAAAWRWSLAAAAPCISRDGVLYCWQARDLGSRGLDALRDHAYDQHPLYAVAILGVQRTLTLTGVPSGPESWARAGQAVSFISGMAVVALCGLLAIRVANALPPLPGLPGDPNEKTADAANAGSPSERPPIRWTPLLALAFAAVLPLNTWLSADVMSDQLHAALYLAAAVLLVGPGSALKSLACGAAAGMAFLTRPEGAVLVIGATAAIIAALRHTGVRPALQRLALLAAAFALVAAPYVWLAGRLSPKLDKEPIEQFQVAAVQRPSFLQGQNRASVAQPANAVQFVVNQAASGSPLAALVRQNLDAYALVPAAFYELLRAGRVVVPLLALAALLAVRRQWKSPALIGLAVCAAAHFSLCVLLLHRHGYLHARHLLPIILLLIPFAAAALSAVIARLSAPPRSLAILAVVVASLAPLCWYALRVPNALDAHVREHANWLRENDLIVQGKKLVAGADGRRIAFYADMRWQPWAENEPNPEQRYTDLYGHIVGGAADYFTIETGPGQELAGNAELLARLSHDAAIAGRVAVMKRVSTPAGVTSHLWRFDWSRR